MSFTCLKTWLRMKAWVGAAPKELEMGGGWDMVMTILQLIVHSLFIAALSALCRHLWEARVEWWPLLPPPEFYSYLGFPWSHIPSTVDNWGWYTWQLISFYSKWWCTRKRTLIGPRNAVFIFHNEQSMNPSFAISRAQIHRAEALWLPSTPRSRERRSSEGGCPVSCSQPSRSSPLMPFDARTRAFRARWQD